jgi:hypothetical protein
LRDQRPKLDGKRNQEEQPVEQDDAVGVPESRVFEPLDGKDDKERDNCSSGGVDPEVAVPNIPVADDLER